MIVCIDSDVLIDYFDGVAAAAVELARYETLLLSRIGWMEVLVSARTPAQREVRESFLRHFKLIELDAAVALRAIALRQEHRLGLPDAIVWASALTHRSLLVTRNARHFPPDHPGVRIPYKV